jgi:predicted DNA-binding transcriptional regulator AlpA
LRHFGRLGYLIVNVFKKYQVLGDFGLLARIISLKFLYSFIKDDEKPKSGLLTYKIFLELTEVLKLMKSIDEKHLAKIIENILELQSLHKDEALEQIIGFYRLPQILNLIPMSKSSWWNGINSGDFPEGFNIGSNITVWQKSDIHKLL